MRKYLIKTTKLSRNELKEIKNLSLLCQNHDKFKTKLYWNIIEDRKIPEYDDFLLYLEGNLIGYLAVFLFKEEEAELTALIHPKYRNQGHFKQLLMDGFFELKRRAIKKCQLICNRESKIAEEYFKRLNTTFSHSELEMTTSKFLSFPNLPDLELREYTQDDILDLAKMDSVCFNTAFEKMVFRFLNNIGEKDRKVYVATFEGEKVGKVHIRFDENQKAYIHDLCILPDYRRKKLATAMVMKIMELVSKKGVKIIFLDVEGHNESAINLYKQCGYDITAIHDFWTYSLE